MLYKCKILSWSLGLHPQKLQNFFDFKALKCMKNVIDTNSFNGGNHAIEYLFIITGHTVITNYAWCELHVKTYKRELTRGNL